jgi:hypothetical protein
MKTLAGMILVLALASCAANPAFPECGGARLFFANLGTFGMYGASNCAGRGDELCRNADVDRCVAQGGDPAACRAAIYAPRQPTQINVQPRIVVPAY